MMNLSEVFWTRDALAVFYFILTKTRGFYPAIRGRARWRNQWMFKGKCAVAVSSVSFDSRYGYLLACSKEIKESE
jgi:hypothetical protein